MIFLFIGDFPHLADKRVEYTRGSYCKDVENNGKRMEMEREMGKWRKMNRWRFKKGKTSDSYDRMDLEIQGKNEAWVKMKSKTKLEVLCLQYIWIANDTGHVSKIRLNARVTAHNCKSSNMKSSRVLWNQNPSLFAGIFHTINACSKLVSAIYWLENAFILPKLFICSDMQ